MPDELQILIFNFKGQAEELRAQRRKPVRVAPPDSIPVKQPSIPTAGTPAATAPASTSQSTQGKQQPPDYGELSVLAADDDETGVAIAIEKLNGEADRIASEIQAEIQKHVSFATVQAEISFSRGSLLVAGTISLLSWVGIVAFETIKDELAQVIRVTVKRIIGRVCNNQRVFGPMEINVTPQTVTRARKATGDRAENAPAAQTEATLPAVVAPTVAAHAAPMSAATPRNWLLIGLLVITGLTLLIQLITFATRHVAISLKP